LWIYKEKRLIMATFKRDQDPLKSMGLGYGDKLNTKAWKVIMFIKNAGEEGVGLTDIQKFIWTEIQGLPEADFWKKDSIRGYGNKPLRQSRGWWIRPLYGGGYSNTQGIFSKFCKKNDKGKWVLVRMPEPGENLVESEKPKFIAESLNEFLNERYIK
jgi:hypothetical protein